MLRYIIDEGKIRHKFFVNDLYVVVGAFSGRIGLPPAVTGWAASHDDGP